jgi:hypothetical protein
MTYGEHALRAYTEETGDWREYRLRCCVFYQKLPKVGTDRGAAVGTLPAPARTCVRQNSVFSILPYFRLILPYYRTLLP